MQLSLLKDNEFTNFLNKLFLLCEYNKFILLIKCGDSLRQGPNGQMKFIKMISPRPSVIYDLIPKYTNGHPMKNMSVCSLLQPTDE